MSSTVHLVLRCLAILLVCLAAYPVNVSASDISNGTVKIGVLNDQSGPYSDFGGRGSVVAAELAIEDFKGKVAGATIELIAADHQNKPDVASAIARRWIDTENVDVIADLPVSSVALAVQEIGRQKRVITMTQATSSDLAGKACTPYATQWADDTYSLSVASVSSLVAEGIKSWFFITADFAFGHALQRDASAAIAKNGGTVAGSVRHALNATDFSSEILRAQQSRSQIVVFANGGSDLVNALKQSADFGLTQSGQKAMGFLIYLTDVHSLGLRSAQNLLISSSFYWDRDDASRAFAQRFFAKHNKMPTREQAAVYASVVHYLKAIEQTRTDNSDTVRKAMGSLPVSYLGRSAELRADGRLVYGSALYRVKMPAESRYAWDYYELVKEIPADQVFRSLQDNECPLVAK